MNTAAHRRGLRIRDRPAPAMEIALAMRSSIGLAGGSHGHRASPAKANGDPMGSPSRIDVTACDVGRRRRHQPRNAPAPKVGRCPISPARHLHRLGCHKIETDVWLAKDPVGVQPHVGTEQLNGCELEVGNVECVLQTVVIGQTGTVVADRIVAGAVADSSGADPAPGGAPVIRGATRTGAGRQGRRSVPVGVRARVQVVAGRRSVRHRRGWTVAGNRGVRGQAMGRAGRW